MPYNIKKRREELGLTLEEIGKFVGVSKGTVKKWESGFIKNMRRDKLVRLADILQVSPMDFLLENPSAARLSEQKKVPLNEELKKAYDKFMLSVFGTLHNDPAIIVFNDNSLTLVNATSVNIEAFLKNIS